MAGVIVNVLLGALPFVLFGYMAYLEATGYFVTERQKSRGEW